MHFFLGALRVNSLILFLSILSCYHSFVEVDNEIFSMVSLLLPLIQEGLVSVTSESMCTKYWLTA